MKAPDEGPSWRRRRDLFHREAVLELAKLLANERLHSWARIGLEAIPGPEADAALRAAAATLSGNLLVGTLNTIGVRKDAGALQILTQRLGDRDPEVASAAAVTGLAPA